MLDSGAVSARVRVHVSADISSLVSLDECCHLRSIQLSLTHSADSLVSGLSHHPADTGSSAVSDTDAFLSMHH